MEKFKELLRKGLHEITAQEVTSFDEFTALIPRLGVDSVECRSGSWPTIDPTQTIGGQKYAPNIGETFGSLFKAKRNGLTLARFEDRDKKPLFKSRDSQETFHEARLRALLRSHLKTEQLRGQVPKLRLQFRGFAGQTPEQVEALLREAEEREIHP
ncbi:MAG: hypothetical protein ABIO02_00080 [Patescibacteria group bacterium]